MHRGRVHWARALETPTFFAALKFAFTRVESNTPGWCIRPGLTQRRELQQEHDSTRTVDGRYEWILAAGVVWGVFMWFGKGVVVRGRAGGGGETAWPSGLGHLKFAFNSGVLSTVLDQGLPKGGHYSTRL